MKIYKVDYRAPDAEAIREAAAIIKEGGIVAIPTETVYGLAAACDNPRSKERLDAVKQRPAEKPYTVHIAEARALEDFDCKITSFLYPLIDNFWPGPLTILVWSQRYGAPMGFRMPDDAIARSIISRCGGKILLPSANIHGRAPAVTGEEVVRAFDGIIDAVVDAGKTRYRVASTIVDATGEQAVIVREGAVRARAIYRVIKK